MEDILRQILTEMKQIKADIAELKSGQARLELEQQKLQQNLIESLGTYKERMTKRVDAKAEVLNKRVFIVESEIERINGQ